MSSWMRQAKKDRALAAKRDQEARIENERNKKSDEEMKEHEAKIARIQGETVAIVAETARIKAETDALKASAAPRTPPEIIEASCKHLLKLCVFFYFILHSRR